MVFLFNDVGNQYIEVDIFDRESILQAVRKPLDGHFALSLNTRSGVFRVTMRRTSIQKRRKISEKKSLKMITSSNRTKEKPYTERIPSPERYTGAQTTFSSTGC